MKHRLIALPILIFGIWMSSFGQKASNKSYHDILKENDITLSLPSGFKLTDLGKDNPIGLPINPGYTPKYGFSGRNIGWTYSLGLKSEEEDCVLLYSTVVPQFVSLSSIIEDEVQASMSDSDLDISDYIKMVTDSDMTEYANADTVLIYDLQLKVPFLGKYTNATGIYLQKYAHPAMLLKVLMDDEGIKNKTQYIKTILCSIKYGDSATPEGLAGEKSFHTPIKFPRPKSPGGKHKEGYIN